MALTQPLKQPIQIIGLGISGTFLSYYLYKAGIPFIVYDDNQPITSSKIASGVINPVTGRRIVRTWMIETLMPFAVNAYKAIETLLNINIIHQCNILDFHATAQMHQAFNERVAHEPFLKKVDDTNSWRHYFNFPFGIGQTNPCYLIDLSALIQAWSNFLLAKNLLIQQRFSATQISEAIKHSQQITVFCNGTNTFTLPLFNKLPYAFNKGEALIIALKENLPRHHIYKQGISLVPWQQNLWWVGSVYEWNFDNELPSATFKQKTMQQLNNWLKIPFEVVEHVAAVRPATLERRPFVGFHPTYNHIGILNGMGTKGCTLAPYFANELVEHLTHNTSINNEASINRFTKILNTLHNE